jgi:hypothetical protein
MSWTRVALGAAVAETLRRQTFAVWGGVLVAALVLALLESRAASAFAYDRALMGPAFGLLLPLSCFALARQLFRGGLEPALAPFAGLGVNRRRLLAGRGMALLLGAVACALPLGLVVLTVAGPTASWPRELAALSWVGVLAGLAYGALLLAGAAVGRHGPWLVLLLDWLFGGGNGWFALPWPRGHLRGLLGGEAVLHLSQVASAFALFGLVALCLAVSFARTAP